MKRLLLILLAAALFPHTGLSNDIHIYAGNFVYYTADYNMATTARQNNFYIFDFSIDALVVLTFDRKTKSYYAITDAILATTTYPISPMTSRTREAIMVGSAKETLIKARL